MKILNQVSIASSKAHYDFLKLPKQKGEKVVYNFTNIANTVQPGDESVFQLDTSIELSNLEVATEVDKTTVQELVFENSVLTNLLVTITSSMKKTHDELNKLHISPYNHEIKYKITKKIYDANEPYKHIVQKNVDVICISVPVRKLYSTKYVVQISCMLL